MTMTLIETKTLGTAAASIEFTSIPQTFTDLVFIYSLRCNQSVTRTNQLKFNATTVGFSARTLLATGFGVQSFTATNRFAQVGGSDSTANTFTNDSLYIPNYASAANKSFSIDHTRENNGTGASIEISAGLWSNTAAITSVEVFPDVGAFLEHSSVSLYGITKGSDGIVTTS